MNKLIYFFAWCGITMGIILCLMLTFWMVYPYNPIVFNEAEFPVAAKQIKQGDMLFYTTDYCKYTTLPARVTRSFINSIIYVTPTTITNRPTGCHVIVIGTLVPKELPLGMYYAEMSYQYQVNPIRTITIKVKTEEFEVIQ
jgi:hypothetical protein